MAIQFTDTEKEQIVRITEEYGSLMRNSIELQSIINDAEKQLITLAHRMDELKERESHFFFDLASKYDKEPKTVQIEAANYVMNNGANEVSQG